MGTKGTGIKGYAKTGNHFEDDACGKGEGSANVGDGGKDGDGEGSGLKGIDSGKSEGKATGWKDKAKGFEDEATGFEGEAAGLKGEATGLKGAGEGEGGKDSNDDGEDSGDGQGNGSGDEDASSSETEGGMRIFVKMPTLTRVKVWVNDSDTIALVKRLLRAKIGVRQRDQRLLLGAQDLDDARHLSHYGVVSDAVLDMMIVGAGGATGVQKKTKKTKDKGVLKAERSQEQLKGLKKLAEAMTGLSAKSKAVVALDLKFKEILTEVDQGTDVIKKCLQGMDPAPLLTLQNKMSSTNNTDHKSNLVLRCFFGVQIDAVDKEAKELTSIIEDATIVMDYIIERSIYQLGGKIAWKTLLELIQNVLAQKVGGNTQEALDSLPFHETVVPLWSKLGPWSENPLDFRGLGFSVRGPKEPYPTRFTAHDFS